MPKHMTDEEKEMMKYLMTKCKMIDREVGELMGVLVVTVTAFRRRNGIKANHDSVLPRSIKESWSFKPITKTLRRYYPAPENKNAELLEELAVVMGQDFLTERQGKAINMWLQNLSHEAIGDKLSLTGERIRGILRGAFRRIALRLSILESPRDARAAEEERIYKESRKASMLMSQAMREKRDRIVRVARREQAKRRTRETNKRLISAIFSQKTKAPKTVIEKDRAVIQRERDLIRLEREEIREQSRQARKERKEKEAKDRAEEEAKSRGDPPELKMIKRFWELKNKLPAGTFDRNNTLITRVDKGD